MTAGRVDRLVSTPELGAVDGDTLLGCGLLTLWRLLSDRESLGSVVLVNGIRHPITLARRVMESDHVLFVGRGAEGYAETHMSNAVRQPFLLLPEKLSDGQQ
jgi:beta-aspartyl-peptidase (threonine type)